jgi:tetratricopeptide (TPR) repeat protein
VSLGEHYQRGAALLEANQLDDAARVFRLIVRKSGKQVVEGYVGLAVALERSRKFQEAFEVYKKGIQHHPEDSKLSKNFCVLLLQLVQENAGFYRDWEDVKNVRFWCISALKKNPKDPYTISLIGDMFTLLMEWDAAAAQYKVAIQMHRDSGSRAGLIHSLTNSANAFSRGGQVQKGITACEVATFPYTLYLRLLNIYFVLKRLMEAYTSTTLIGGDEYEAK